MGIVNNEGEVPSDLAEEPAMKDLLLEQVKKQGESRATWQEGPGRHRAAPSAHAGRHCSRHVPASPCARIARARLQRRAVGPPLQPWAVRRCAVRWPVRAVTPQGRLRRGM